MSLNILCFSLDSWFSLFSRAYRSVKIKKKVIWEVFHCPNSSSPKAINENSFGTTTFFKNLNIDKMYPVQALLQTHKYSKQKRNQSTM